MVRILWAFTICLAASSAWAKDAAPAADDPAVEARMINIAAELRCLVCQNQTIADSHAELAQDLREQVRVLVRKGQSDQQVRDYMTARYGDFVLYRPTVQPRTLMLWFGPAAMMLVGCGALVQLLRRRARLGDDQFEPDEEADDDWIADPVFGGRP